MILSGNLQRQEQAQPQLPPQPFQSTFFFLFTTVALFLGLSLTKQLLQILHLFVQPSENCQDRRTQAQN